MQIAKEIVDVSGSLWAILMIVGMFKHVNGDKWYAAPYGPIMMLIDEHVKQTF